jgi:hypothetical protein
MTGKAEDWRVERQDERIKRLEDDLWEAKQQIRELERRPMEWLLKAELWIIWIATAAFWIYLIVESAQKH